MMTFALPATSFPDPPQCCCASFIRCAGLPLMLTCGAPLVAVHMFKAQHAAWTPMSSWRSAGMLLIKTSNDPRIAGPVGMGWGQAGQPCASL